MRFYMITSHKSIAHPNAALLLALFPSGVLLKAAFYMPFTLNNKFPRGEALYAGNI
jgi:hypothetical protein